MRKNDSILYLTVTDQRNNRIADISGPGEADAANPINDFTYTLSNLFRNVIPYDYLKNYFEKGVKKTNNEIFNLAKREKPQYLLWRAHDFQVLESTLQAMRETGSIVIAWFWDDHFRFDTYARLYIPSVDYSVTVDPNAIDKYNSLGARCVYIPGGCAGEYYKKLDLPNKYDVSFVGNNAWKRDVFVKKFKNLGIEVATFGRGWDSGHIPFDQMLNIFNSSKINLNFSQVGPESTKQLKGRIFEIAMCGGFVLTEYVPEIERFFKLNREIVCFESVQEAVNKIKYYLANNHERQAIAQAGRERAQRNYSWSNTLPHVFEEIEKDIEINGRPNISPDNAEVPEQARLTSSCYHYRWARVWFIQNRPDLCKDELKISLKYDPNSFKSRRLLLISRLPKLIQPGMFHIISKTEDAFERIRNKVGIRTRLRSILRHLNF